MRIGYYLDGGSPAHLALARHAIASARRAVPGAEVVHLTTPDGPAMAEADTRFEVAAEGHYTRRRAVVQAAAGGGLLLLDVDTVLCADVRTVMDQDFDIALPEVSDPAVRYTGAVMFVKHPGFWRQWQADPVWQQPYEVRQLLRAFTACVDAWPGRVLRLPEARYERLPRSAADPLDGAAIVHYRGPRKAWLGL